MDGEQAHELSEKRNTLGSLELFFSEFRQEVARELNADHLLAEDDVVGISGIEILLSEPNPYEGLYALIGINKWGIWAMDGDGHHNGPVWRQHLIPWSKIRGVILHQSS